MKKKENECAETSINFDPDFIESVEKQAEKIFALHKDDFQNFDGERIRFVMKLFALLQIERFFRSRSGDLDVMSRMADSNLDIRCTTHFMAANKDSRGGVVSMGIDEKTLLELVFQPDKFLTALYFINKKQFFALKKGENLPVDHCSASLAEP